MAGFECATGCNRNGELFDQVAATEHDVNMLPDYRRAVAAGMRVVREGVRWPVIDQGNQLDLASLDLVLQAAAATGVVPIFDLFHYGYPCDLDIFSPEFVKRFRRYCGAVACHIAAFGQPPYYFTPIN